MNQDLYRTIEEGGSVNVAPVAKAAGVAPATLYRAINRGEIEATRIGKRMTIPAHVAREILRLRKPEASEQRAA